MLDKYKIPPDLIEEMLSAGSTHGAIAALRLRTASAAAATETGASAATAPFFTHRRQSLAHSMCSERRPPS